MRFTPTIHLLATMAGSFILANAYSGDLGGAHKAGDLAIRAAKPAIDSPKVQDMPVSTADKEITTVTITMHDTTMSTTIINTIIDPSKLTPITPCTDSTTAVAPESVVTVTSAVAPESVIPASTSAVLPESVVTVTSAVAPESIGTASGTDTTFLTPGPSIPANNSSYYTSTYTSTISNANLTSTITVATVGNITYSLSPSNSTLLTAPAPSITSHKTTAAATTPTTSSPAATSSTVHNAGPAMVSTSSVSLLSSIIMGTLAVFMLTLA